MKLLHLPVGADNLANEVTLLRRSLNEPQNPVELAFPTSTAYDLYRQVFEPAKSFLSGARQILLVPDGALQSLPFEVLVTRPSDQAPSNAHPEDNRQTAWLARDVAIAVLPSVGSFQVLRQVTPRSNAARPFLGVGDPVLTGSSQSNLLPLPETSAELQKVAAILGASQSDLLLRERANEPMLRATPINQYRIVEFATHGLVANELDIPEPALVLTPAPEDDGLLTASKIATLAFNADWIVLSACNTAGDNGRPGADGVSGLAKAFFYAGSRSLLVSHWEVKSLAAVNLITDTFTQLSANPTITRAEALRRSEMSLLDATDVPPRYAHPMYWAPFSYIGDGGR